MRILTLTISFVMLLSLLIVLSAKGAIINKNPPVPPPDDPIWPLPPGRVVTQTP